MTSAYADPDAQMTGPPGLYGNQTGTPPAQQQQQQHLSETELRLQENLQQQLREGGDMMHPGNPQPPQYAPLVQMQPNMGAHQHFQQNVRPTHSPQQMAHAVMSLEGHHDQFDPNDPSRKRSKVSRACDECRRKKIRCDATSENGPEACSSCKRTGARCQFSRQPMKRGPSKGYIKELADRLNSLESQMQHPTASSNTFDFGSISEQNFGNAQSPPQFTRKRTHSMSEEFQDAFSRPAWSAQDRELPLNGNRRTSFGEMSLIGSLVTVSNEETLKAYANIIHPTLPILPHDSSTLNRLTHCPAKVREAFFLCLEGCLRSVAPRSLPKMELPLNHLLHQCFTAVDAAKMVLHDADNSRQLYNNLVFCQSLVLLAIASDRPITAGVVGSTAQLLGQISGCISDAGLNDTRTLQMLREHDQDAYLAARRIFWTTFVIDRFHASSKSGDLMLPMQPNTLSRDEHQALGGDIGFHLARASEIVGQIAFVTRAGSIPNPEPSSLLSFSTLTSTSPHTIFLNGLLNCFRESIDITNMTSESPPHLAYQYLRLLASRLSAHTSHSTEVLSITKELLANLINGAITPLHHIFAGLVATSLVELSDRLETQVEAHASIKEMSDALANGQILYRSSDGLGWDILIRETLHQRKSASPPMNNVEQTSPVSQPNMAGLQHLAAAAVGERGGSEVRPASSSGNVATSQQSKIDHDLSAAMAAANEAAKAQATAAAAQQLSSSPNGTSANAFDSTGLTKDWS